MTKHLSESERRAQILRSARAVFIERGFEAARVEDVAKRAGLSKGAVYFSCLARGPNMFGPNSRELTIVQEALGPVPLVGFFCNGEISHDRLYSYTGVLTLFV